MEDIFKLIQEMTLERLGKKSSRKNKQISEISGVNVTANIPMIPVLEIEERINDEDVDDLSKVYKLIFEANNLFELVDNVDKIPDKVRVLVEDELVEQDVDLTSLNPYFVVRLRDLYLLDEIEAFQLVSLFPHLYQYFVATDLGISFYMLFLMIAVVKYFQKDDYKLFAIKLKNIYKFPMIWYQEVTQPVFEELLRYKVEEVVECMRKLVDEKPNVLQTIQAIYPVSTSCVKTLNYFIFNKEPQILTDMFDYALSKKDIAYESLVSECGYQLVKMLKVNG